MNWMKKNWFIVVFVLLTLRIFSEQKYLFSSQPYPGVPYSYGAWPTKTYQGTESLKGLKEGVPTMFRGNYARQGWVEGHLSDSYTEDWRFPMLNDQIHSAAKSSPVADEDGIYVGSDMGWFYHLGWDGKVRWRVSNVLSLKGIHGTATLDGDFLFYGDYSGYLHALNKKTGEFLWQRFLGETLGASPLVLGDAIYANVELYPPNGYIAKFNKLTGEMLFKSALFGEQSHSSLSYDEKNKNLLFGTNNDHFIAINVNTGDFGWSYLAKSKIKDSPVIYNNVAYYTDWGPQFYGNDVTTGLQKFAVPLKSRSQSSPALMASGLVVMDRNNLYHFSFDGKLLKELNMFNTVHLGSPLVVRDGGKEKILAICHNTNLCVVDSELKSMKVIFKGSQNLSAVPFLFKDRLILAQDKGDLIVLKRQR